MSVARLELSKELFEVSNWLPTDKVYLLFKEGTIPIHTERQQVYIDNGASWICPAYDLGYLIRTLPQRLIKGKKEYWLTLELCDAHEQIEWTIDYICFPTNRLISPENFYFGAMDPDITHANTPEDSAAKLAIKLFKEGKLKRETK